MDQKKSVRDVQHKILEVMKYIDGNCRKNGIVYYIMGGTALGAIRHGGFIPWYDDLDIFMTPAEYEKFKAAMAADGNEKYMLQEWRTVKKHLEYLGFVVGGNVTVITSLGGNVIVNVKEARVAISEEMARKIMV